MTDFTEVLREMAVYSIDGDLRGAALGAADLIDALEAERDKMQKERDRLRAERHPRVEELEEHIANMLEMQECACGHDDPMDVCLGHATILKRIEALKTENGRMREALRPFVEYVHDDLRRGNAAYVLMPCSTSGGGWIGAEDLRRASAAFKGEGE